MRTGSSASLALMAAMVLAGCEAELLRMPSGSMLPTLAPGEIFVADRSAYESAKPKRGDVIVFYPPSGAEPAVGERRCLRRDPRAACALPAPGRLPYRFIMRIVALPRDTLSIDSGRALVNGERVEEPYVTRCGKAACDLPRPITIPPGHYFVLGDNRGASLDSRFWGPVPFKQIFGKAIYK